MMITGRPGQFHEVDDAAMGMEGPKEGSRENSEDSGGDSNGVSKGKVRSFDGSGGFMMRIKDGVTV